MVKLEYCYGATTSGPALGERFVCLVGLPKLTPATCALIFLTWSRRSEPRSARGGNIIQSYARNRAD